MTYFVTKTYDHSIGLSCAFRQWRATDTNCSYLHGYALAFKFTFSTDYLDSRNWTISFGALKGLKELLVEQFDHTTVVAEDDPELEMFKAMHERKIIQLRIIPDVGCEKFAELAYRVAANWMEREGHSPRVNLVSVEVSEHGANSAIYQPN